MKKQNILLIEDNEDDALLLYRTLEQGEMDVCCRRVDSEAGLLPALNNTKWDLVISDFSLPGFSGLQALKIVRSRNADLPFIAISRAITEEAAVELMRAGAQDVILKSKLSRLTPAIHRELKAMETRRQEKAAHAILQSQLLQTQRLEILNHIIGGIAHDFNNLLSVVLSYSELILENSSENDSCHKPARTIMQTALTASSLISKLLNFSRPDKHFPQVLCLNQVVKDTVLVFSRLISKNVLLEMNLDGGLLPLVAERIHLEQIIMNLVINANDSLENKGIIVVETRNVHVNHQETFLSQRLAPGIYIRLRVRDTGRGIDPADLPRIFDTYFTTKEKGKGTGLGLAVCSEIVKQYNGAIFVESEPGKGSVFDVYFSHKTNQCSSHAGLPDDRTKDRTKSEGSPTWLPNTTAV